MSINKILGELDLMPSKEDIAHLKSESRKIAKFLAKELKKIRVKAKIFLGGSFIKGTLIKSPEGYDVDIFVRFDKKHENNLSELLEKTAGRCAKEIGYKIEKIHGSRDYFRLWKDKKIIFELVPVLEIRNQKEAKNVTDLSYFHVNYIKKKKSKKLAGQIAIAKQFCKAQEVYGAESYINGFSGYGLECLIVYYKTFEKMLRELSKIKEREIIDPEKKFKSKKDALIELNSAKLRSPIILIDPTFRERNALAALSLETFKKFQEKAREFLKKPSREFFEIKKFSPEEIKEYAKKHNAELLHIGVFSEKQAGDIAGTKMKKFAEFFSKEIEKYFEILKSKFSYSGAQDADIYFALKSRGEIEKRGPPLEMHDECRIFREENKNVFEKSGRLMNVVKIDFSAFEFAKKWVESKKKTIESMGIAGMRLF